MASVFDVATYILEKTERLSTWKLQKLVYYSQAWHCVWSDQPMFRARIEAWENGPVCPELYKAHRGEFIIDSLPKGDSSQLSDDEKDSIDKVVETYNHYNGQQLSRLTHAEEPWQLARLGLERRQRGSKEITLESMARYYDSILDDDDDENHRS